MLPSRFLPAAILACCAYLAAPAVAVEPTPLDAQIKRLAGLLGDSYASAYPETARIQQVPRPDGGRLALALFTIESYGGGNNHRQYLAVFEEEIDESGPRGHFMLLGVAQVGAKGWRAIRDFKVDAGFDAAGRTLLAIPAFANVPSDAANFPSRATTIHLVLDRAGLAEVQGESKR